MSNYPNIIDTFALPAGTQTLDSPDHSLDHRNLGSATVGIENVLGINSGTNILKNFTAGNFAARTNNETFGTPTLVGGTYNSGVFGTPTSVGGIYTAGTFGTPIVVGAFSNGNISNNGTIDWSKGDIQYGTLTGNGTLIYSNAVAFQRLTLLLVENATGGFTITLPASQYPNGNASSFGTNANMWNGIVVIYNTAGSYLTQSAVAFS